MLQRIIMSFVALALLGAVAAGEGKQKNVATRTIGDMEVVALLDGAGIASGDGSILIGATDADLERAKASGGLVNSINAFLVRINGKTILFDTGMAITATGGILPALKAAKVPPDAIDAVVVTHFHYDHVGGLMHRGQPVYPKAELYVPRVEVDKWSGAGTEFLLAYSVRSNAFEAGREILPGVTAIAAYGHTPGHTIFRLSSGGGELLIIGDLIHVPSVQLANPDVAVTYDTDPVAAVAARKKAFDMAAAEKLPIAAMHIPFPGLGVLTKDGAGYAFEAMK